MVGMELLKDPGGRVTHLAFTRALRGLSHQALGHAVGVRAEDVLAWETGDVAITTAKAKRLGLAMRWPWEAFMYDPMDYDEAYEKLLKARRKSAEATPRSVAVQVRGASEG